MLPPLPRVWAALTGRPRPEANSSREFAQLAGPVESELRLVICHPTRGASCRGHQLHDLSYVDVVDSSYRFARSDVVALQGGPLSKLDLFSFERPGSMYFNRYGCGAVLDVGPRRGFRR